MRRFGLSPDGTQLRRLAQAFDQSFAEETTRSGQPPAGFLAASVAGVAFAVPLPDLAGVVPAGRIAPVPSPAPALLGIAAVATRLVPVYAPPPLLGHGPLAGGAVIRWLLVLRTRHPLALAITQIDGHARLAASEVRRATAAGGWDAVRIRTRLAADPGFGADSGCPGGRKQGELRCGPSEDESAGPSA